jgi:hypothetical protein
MNTTLTRPITSTAAQTNAVRLQSKSDATEALNTLIDAKALIKGARLLIGDDVGYESKNELIHATQALLAAEEIMLSMGRKADNGDMNIDGDAHNVTSIVFLTREVIWGEHAPCSDDVVHACTLLDKAYEVVSELASSAAEIKVTH